MYLFALFLGLYEFTAYSANDMIMPGMIQVVNHFQASKYYVALSFSAYILGNSLFLLIAGFLSEKYGKRRIMLLGNFLFLLFTLIIIFSTNIHQFILFRFLQGAGLAIIPIGYALIHEHFSDVAAIKLTALMANVSMLAPLVGPAFGSLIMSFFSWQYIFCVTAIFSAITFAGLTQYIPRDHLLKSTINISQVVKQYIVILRNKEFFLGMICSAFIIMPLMIWISQAPNLILYKLHLNYTHYVVYQLISVGGLTISSILMQFIVGKYRLYSIVHLGNSLILIGLLISLLGSNYIELIAIGLMIYALGMGLANGCIWRLIMTIKGHSQAMLASMLGFVQSLLFAIGISLTNEFISYHKFALWSFSSSLCLFGFIGFLLITIYISGYRHREWL